MVGFQENTFSSNSNIISCVGNTTIKIVDLLVEQHTTSCSETKHCNLTEGRRIPLKGIVIKKEHVPYQSLFQAAVCLMIMDVYPFHIHAQFILTGHSNSSCTFENGGLNDNCGWYIQGSTRYRWELRKGKLHHGIQDPTEITRLPSRGNGYRSDIAVDDILISNSACDKGLTDYTESCRKMDESILLYGCLKYYLQLDKARLIFDQELENCSAVYQNIQASRSTLCNYINNSDICTLSLSEVIQKDSRCFLSNSLLIEYKCEERVNTPNILSDDAQKINAPVDKESVISLQNEQTSHLSIIGLVARFVQKNKENKKNGYNTNNSACNRTASLASVTADNNNRNSQLTTTQSNHCNNVYANTEFKDDIIEPDCEYSNIAHTNSVINKKVTTTAKFRNYQGDVPSYNISSKQDDNDFADLTNKTRFIKKPIHQTDSTKSNMIIEPQGNIFEGSEFYTLAKPTCFSNENHQLKDENNDVYCSTEEGTYNFPGSDCHKEAEGNIYSHTVDDVYDSTTHKRKDDDQEDKYDHFIGQLTEDVYVISN
ncbi:unnamed protein product [Mytilus edulis]|uniref:MAM domain-containing protein n=1 Tax=Mytilus edulis TaxID=6550 RepID=A0A8S3UYY1_MYTED|nr:unnamed protein product [Mytilus edulis]